MTWIPWVIGIVAVIVVGLFLVSKMKGWPVFRRREKTIEKEIEELDKEKEAADEDIESRRADYHDRNPFD